MDFTAGLQKLDRIIKAKQSLEEKMEKGLGNFMVERTIEAHKDTIANIKKELNFEARFEVNTLPISCKCGGKCDENDSDLPKEGDLIEEGEVQGIYVKVKTFKKDGSISNCTKYVEIK